MTISNDKDNENEVELTTTAEKEVSQSCISANTRKGNGGKNFPDPFYCPITKKVMDDPVVLSDGVSYEKSAVTSREENMYPNRALKAVIDDAVAASGTSVRAAVVRIQHSMRKVYNEVLEKKYRPLSDVYYGPITFSLIHEPVIDPEGHTFEKVAIVTWIRENGSSPLTRTELSIGDLFPNHAIKELLNIEKNRDESSIHPSIRKFKAEEPPKPNGDVDPETGGVVGEGDFPTNHEELAESERGRNAREAKTFTCGDAKTFTSGDAKTFTCVAIIIPLILLAIAGAPGVIFYVIHLCGFYFLYYCLFKYQRRSEESSSRIPIHQPQRHIIERCIGN